MRKAIAAKLVMSPGGKDKRFTTLDILSSVQLCFVVHFQKGARTLIKFPED